MRKTFLVLFGTTLALASCGSSTKTVTLNYSNAGTTLSIVVSGDSNAIDGFKQGAAQSLASASSGNSAEVDGDQHTGNQVCQTDVTNSGVTLHVVVYSNSSAITSDVCSTLASAAAQATP